MHNPELNWRPAYCVSSPVKQQSQADLQPRHWGFSGYRCPSSFTSSNSDLYRVDLLRSSDKIFNIPHPTHIQRLFCQDLTEALCRNFVLNKSMLSVRCSVSFRVWAAPRAVKSHMIQQVAVWELWPHADAGVWIWILTSTYQLTATILKKILVPDTFMTYSHPAGCTTHVLFFNIQQIYNVIQPVYLVGCETRQRLGESCTETLQGFERMLIKASYSTASSFLTVPAAGSTTLGFLATSSALSLSALLYFCLFLSPSPSVSHPFPFARSSTCHLEAQTADVWCCLDVQWQLAWKWEI